VRLFWTASFGRLARMLKAWALLGVPPLTGISISSIEDSDCCRVRRVLLEGFSFRVSSPTSARYSAN